MNMAGITALHLAKEHAGVPIKMVGITPGKEACRGSYKHDRHIGITPGK